MMNLNTKQIISIIGAVLSAVMISTAQLTDLFGADMAKTVVSVAGMGNLVIQSVMTAITGQDATVRDVLDMRGIQHIEVNDKANKTLAKLAVDPSVDKIAPSRAAEACVAKTAVEG